eukprot:448235-Hanusia_phi.AAC.1
MEMMMMMMMEMMMMLMEMMMKRRRRRRRNIKEEGGGGGGGMGFLRARMIVELVEDGSNSVMDSLPSSPPASSLLLLCHPVGAVSE